MDRSSAVSHAAREQRGTIAAVSQRANRPAVARHNNSGLDAAFPTFERTIRAHIAAEIAAMTSLARHHAVEGFGAGWRVARRQPRYPTNGRQGKRPAVGAAHVVGSIHVLVTRRTPIAIHFLQNINAINDPSAIRQLTAVERSCLIMLLQYDNHMS
jgi:hypothetical protein